MSFEHTSFLILGAGGCVALVWAFRRMQRTHRVRLLQIASPHLVEQLTANVSSRRRMVKFSLLILATACAFVALARPQAGFRWEETQRRGIDIMLAVDTSKSMLANDVQPNRLERARLGILDFVDRLDGDRVGLIPFSGTAFLMCPLTLDYDAFRQSLATLNTSLMPRGGTDIASAIREAEAAFDQDANHRILVLITDGEDLQGEALAAAEAAARRGITIHTVGVGTPAGELIPLGGAGFLKDEQGQVVKSRLDEDMLRKIAEATGGAYEPFGRRAEGLDAIYQQKLSLVPEEAFAQRMHKVPLERFEWPLLVAIFLLAMEYLLSDRKVARRSPRALVVSAGRRLMRRRRVAVPVALLLLGAASDRVQASPRDAEQAYLEGAYPAAVEQYQDALARSPEDARLVFNAGAALYRTDSLDEAAGAFSQVTSAEDLSLQEQGYYNLGNTLYRRGQQTEQTAPEQTLQQWQEALKAYEGALALNAEDEDTLFNHELVKRRLEELQKQQEEQQQEQDPPCDSPEEQDDGDSQDDSDQGGQDQENQDEATEGDGSDENQESGQGEEDPSEDEDASSGGDTGEEEEPGEPDDGQGNQPEEGSDEGEESSPVGGGSDDEQEPSAQPESTSGTPEVSDVGEEKQNAPSGVGERRQAGEMSPEEAADLLDSLKEEDGDTPFVPAAQGNGGAQDEDGRDW